MSTNGKHKTTVYKPRFNYPRATVALVDALSEEIRNELRAHLPPVVWEVVSDLECMSMDHANVHWVDMIGYAEDVEKAAWFFANGETMEESEAKNEARKSSVKPTAKRNPVAKKGGKK